MAEVARGGSPGTLLRFSDSQIRDIAGTAHLFQNRFESILVEEEPYLLELVRNIHLNSRARALFSFAAAHGLDLPVGAVARHLGVSTQSVCAASKRLLSSWRSGG